MTKLNIEGNNLEKMDSLLSSLSKSCWFSFLALLKQPTQIYWKPLEIIGGK